MTHQEAFDLALNHLRQQGRRAINDLGLCVYRGPDNTKCAVGALIPDDKYDPEFDEDALAANGASTALSLQRCASHESNSPQEALRGVMQREKQNLAPLQTSEPNHPSAALLTGHRPRPTKKLQHLPRTLSMTR